MRVEDEEYYLSELELLYQKASGLSELKYIINEKWINRVRKTIISMGPDGKYDDDSFWFFKCLTDRNSYPFIEIELFDKKLKVVENLARSQNKLRSYRKTRIDLSCKDVNQIKAALYEYFVLAYLIDNSSDNIELYPKFGNGNKDVDVKINVDGRSVYIEVKSIGYSDYDPHGICSHSIESMIKQIHDALDSKLAEGAQLELISETKPTILCIGLGYNADETSGRWGIEEYIETKKPKNSLFILTRSPIWDNFQFLHNPYTPLPLTSIEVSFFKSALRSSF